VTLFFCATGITPSEVLAGIEIIDNNYISETLVTHKSSDFKEIIKEQILLKNDFCFGQGMEAKKINQNLVEKLKQDYNFSDILSRLIISRKFNEDEIATIDNDLSLNNIFLNNSDFQQSIDLVVGSINNKEKYVF